MDGPDANTANIIFSQTIPQNTLVLGENAVTIINSPVLNSNIRYCFLLDGGPGGNVDGLLDTFLNPDPDPNNDCFYGSTIGGLVQSAGDIRYRIEIESVVIPSLSQWGIIALSMIPLILGVVVVRQRNLIFG